MRSIRSVSTDAEVPLAGEDVTRNLRVSRCESNNHQATDILVTATIPNVGLTDKAIRAKYLRKKYIK